MSKIHIHHSTKLTSIDGVILFLLAVFGFGLIGVLPLTQHAHDAAVQPHAGEPTEEALQKEQQTPIDEIFIAEVQARWPRMK